MKIQTKIKINQILAIFGFLTPLTICLIMCSYEAWYINFLGIIISFVFPPTLFMYFLERQSVLLNKKFEQDKLF